MMRRSFMVLLSGAIASVAAQNHLVTSTEMLPEPLGLWPDLPPRFSWRLSIETAASMPRNTVQSSYRLQVSSSAGSLSTGPWVWDSGEVSSNASSLVPYGGDTKGLVPGRMYWWRVACSYATGPVELAVNWSAPARFSVAPAAYTGEFIGMKSSPTGGLPFNDSSCPWLRKSFVVHALDEGDVALAYVGSVGFHELWVNGRKVTDDVLSPQVADLARRIPVRVYDVSALLKEGENVMGLWLSVGWAAYRSGNPSVNILYNITDAPVALAELHLQPAKTGVIQKLVWTNSTWLVNPSDTSHTGLWKNSDFGGDRVDSRLSQPNWAVAGASNEGWTTATSFPVPPGRVLTTEILEPNRMREAVGVNTTLTEKDGTILVQMEQVFTGFIHLTGMTGDPFGTVTIKVTSIPVCNTPFATEAKGEGRPYCLTSAPEYNMLNEVVLDSNGHGDFMPRFSYNEIHYLEITGLKEVPHGIVGFRVGNIADLWPAVPNFNDGGGRSRLGHFVSSSPILNAVYNTSMWTKANLVTGGISVDCPHRERMGYIGDAHTTLETSLQNIQSKAFLEKWLLDIGDIQGFPAHTGNVPHPDGYIAHTAPTIDGGGGPGWSGFVCVMPWQVYLAYGDERILTTAYPHQQRLLHFWSRFVESDGLVHQWAPSDTWAFLGDWLTPHGSENSPTKEALLFNNCYILYCFRIVANVSTLLGDHQASANYTAAGDALAKAIHAEFFVPSTSGYIDTRQGHLVMPLVTGVVPDEHRDAVWAALRKEVLTEQGGHLDTGNIPQFHPSICSWAGLHGTYFMTKLFYDTSFGFGGADDLIYAYATNPTFPGYVDLLKKGYTTWPEAWGTCNDAGGDSRHVFTCRKWESGSQSQMHGTLNGIGQWFVAGLGGIRRREFGVGYQHFELRPAWTLSSSVNQVSASHVSVYGLIDSTWEVQGNRHVYNVTVPPNTRATVYMPASSAGEVREGGVQAENAEGVSFVKMMPSLALFEVGSGTYSFNV